MLWRHRDRTYHAVRVGFTVNDAIVLVHPRLVERIGKFFAGLNIVVEEMVKSDIMFLFADVDPSYRRANRNRDFFRAKKIIPGVHLNILFTGLRRAGTG